MYIHRITVSLLVLGVHRFYRSNPCDTHGIQVGNKDIQVLQYPIVVYTETLRQLVL